jgi:glucose dehydrogenase
MSEFLPPRACPSRGAARVTRTSTGQRSAMLRAYDKATGADVAAVYIPAPQTGSPMIYLLNGEQFLVIAIGGPGYSGEFLDFKLPA